MADAGPVKLELDTTNFNSLIQPVLNEVNDLRRRVSFLEELLDSQIDDGK